MPVGTETEVEEMRAVETSEGETDSPANETLQKEIRDTIADELSNVTAAVSDAEGGISTTIEDQGAKLESQKVDVTLEYESVTVPDGVYWDVMFIPNSGKTNEIVTSSGYTMSADKYDGEPGGISAILHPGTKIDGYGLVTGFEYAYGDP